MVTSTVSRAAMIPDGVHRFDVGVTVIVRAVFDMAFYSE
jgi:hypothetical protein